MLLNFSMVIWGEEKMPYKLDMTLQKKTDIHFIFFHGLNMNGVFGVMEIDG